jgi:hypothetical protein
MIARRNPVGKPKGEMVMHTIQPRCYDRWILDSVTHNNIHPNLHLNNSGKNLQKGIKIMKEENLSCILEGKKGRGDARKIDMVKMILVLTSLCDR